MFDNGTILLPIEEMRRNGLSSNIQEVETSCEIDRSIVDDDHQHKYFQLIMARRSQRRQRQ